LNLEDSTRFSRRYCGLSCCADRVPLGLYMESR